jgi:hypothetical protein
VLSFFYLKANVSAWEPRKPQISTTLRSGPNDKFVAETRLIIHSTHGREWLNKFVISTGAQRSGEICGFLLARTELMDEAKAIVGLRPSFSAHVSGFPARGTTNRRVCGFH